MTMKTLKIFLFSLIMAVTPATQADTYADDGGSGSSGSTGSSGVWSAAQERAFMNSCNRTGTLLRYCTCAMKETQRIFGARIVFRTQQDKINYGKRMYQACGHLIASTRKPSGSTRSVGAAWTPLQKQTFLRGCNGNSTSRYRYCNCALSATMKRYNRQQIETMGAMSQSEKQAYASYLIRQCSHTLR